MAKTSINKPSDLKDNPINPRYITEERNAALGNYMQEFGYLSGIVFNADGTIITGHQRRRQMNEGRMVYTEQYREPLTDGTINRGYFEMPDGRLFVFRQVDWPAEKAARATIVANGQFGMWDSEVLANAWDFEMPELKEMGVPDFVFGGMDMGEAEKATAQEDEYESPEEIVADIVRGDVFEIGPHRLMCGDSTSSDDIERLMDDSRADMVMTDPDFSMDIDLLLSVYALSKAVSSGFGFWICGDRQAAKLAVSDFKEFSKFFVQDFRNATIINNKSPMSRTTLIVQMGRREMNNLFDGFSTLLQIPTERTGEDHKKLPMAKKIELPFQFISHFSNENDLVLDLFGHSGSTMIAAQQLGRRCNMMEIEPKYCQCILDRMQKAFPELKVTRNGQSV